MASLGCGVSPFFLEGFKKHTVIQCNLRDKGVEKETYVEKAQDMSIETMNASRALKLASSALENSNKKSGMEKLHGGYYFGEKNDVADIFPVVVFEYIRKETWYTPDINLYKDMIYMLGRNKLVEKEEYYFEELKKEGLRPDSMTFTEMIGTFSKAGFINLAMETYNDMKKSGCEPTELTIILIRNLQRLGEKEMIEIVREDVNKYIEEPEEFFRKEEIISGD